MAQLSFGATGAIALTVPGHEMLTLLGQPIVGLTLSLTVTVKLQLAVLPEESVTV